jgi:adenine-specific DNA methylase
VIFIYLISFLGIAPKRSIQFFKQEIFIKVDSGNFYLEGEYWFKNRTKSHKNRRYFYPFPIDSLHLYPYEIKMTGAKFKRTPDGVIFDLSFKPKEIKKVNVKYNQKILTNDAEYILTTTQYWGEPLEITKIKISIPKNVEVTLSFEPDTIWKEKERLIYYIDRKEFFPDRNLHIKWQ